MEEKVWREIKEGIEVVFEKEESEKLISKLDVLLKKNEKFHFSFKELRVDSIDQMKLLIFFEDKFKFQVSDNEILKIKTISDFLNLIKKNVPSLRS